MVSAILNSHAFASCCIVPPQTSASRLAHYRVMTSRAPPSSAESGAPLLVRAHVSVRMYSAARGMCMLPHRAGLRISDRGYRGHYTLAPVSAVGRIRRASREHVLAAASTSHATERPKPTQGYKLAPLLFAGDFALGSQLSARYRAMFGDDPERRLAAHGFAQSLVARLRRSNGLER